MNQMPPMVEPSIPTTTYPEQIIPSSPKRSTPFLPILFTFLITTTFFIGGYFGYQKLTPAPSPASSPTPSTTSTTPPPTPDLTVNWPTYNGDKYSFRYPPQFIQSLYQEGNSRGVQLSKSTSGKMATDTMMKTLVIQTITSPESFAQEQWQKDQKQPDFTSMGTITPISTRQIGNKTSYTYKVDYMSDSEVLIIPLSNTSLLRFVINNQSDANLLSQILSTFRFSDNTSPSTTDRQMGFIKSITKNNDSYSLTIDYIEMLNGEAAKQAKVRDGECDNTETCDLPNDFYISNINPMLRTFTIKPDTQIKFSILSNNQVLSPEEFAQIFISTDDYRKQAPYWITIQNNQIIEIREQYLP